MDSQGLSQVYNAFYYAHYTGDEGEEVYERAANWLNFFGRVADCIVTRLQPQTVLDAGCAWGFLVESLRDRGVAAFGVDLSAYAIGRVRPDMRPYCQIGSITEPFQQRYDLITCVEVIEHLPPLDGERAIENLCAHTDEILFSSTPFHYKDATHLNVRPPDYWAELFAYHGFYRDADFDAGFLTPWAVKFRRGREPVARIVASYERRLWQLAKDNQGQRELHLEQHQALAVKDQALQQALAQEATEIRTLKKLLAEKDQLLNRLSAELASITNSRHWKMLQLFWRVRRKLIPPGSLQWKVLRFGWRAIKRSKGFLRASSNAPAMALEILPPPLFVAHQASVEIIICVHNALADVRQCLNSVTHHTRPPYSLILVDDGSAEETREYLAHFAQSQGAHLIRNEQAKGYTFAANQGLRQAQADYAVLLNSDTIVTPGWLDRMIACGESDPRVGIIGPLSNTASWQSIPEVITPADEWPENPLPDGLTVAEMGDLVADYAGGIRPSLPFLNGFCLMIKRAVIERIGHFDEEVFGPGFGEENDYCLRARRAGFRLAVADDAYVYHHQSRSYTHERRKQLSERASQALIAKHGQEIILEGVNFCRHDRVLTGIRARAEVMFSREQMIRTAKAAWEGKRLLFLLPIREPSGGGNVIFQEADALLKMGVDVRILNYPENREMFERGYPDLKLPVAYHSRTESIAELAANYDAIVATAFYSVDWLKSLAGHASHIVRGYYIQDFEPYLLPEGTEGVKTAWDSYTLVPDLVRFAKTEWTRQELKNCIGVDCALVGPSVNLDLFRPRPRKLTGPVRIAAMIRPSTPYRNPQLTMEVLRDLQRKYGSQVSILLFGCDTADPAFQALPRNFTWRNYGLLTRPQLAGLLNEADIFVDFSSHQAMGLSALEAMACGATVVVPRNGGANSFVRHEENGLFAETSNPSDCYAMLARLVADEPFRTRLQRRATLDACQHFPEQAALRMLQTLFPANQ